MAQQPPLQRGSKRGQAGDFESQACGRSAARRAAAASHRPPRQQKLRGQSSQFRLPPQLFLSGQVRYLSQVPAKPWIPILQKRQQLVTDAVACEGQIAI